MSGTWDTKQQWQGFAAYTNPTKNEKQVYVDPDYRGWGFNVAAQPLGLNPFSIDNGVLSITASAAPAEDSQWLGKRPYTSGLITSYSSFQQTYGYFEVRADMPKGQSLWPAFWLLPVDLGPHTELDAFEEIGQDPTHLLMTAHSGATGVHTKENTTILTPDLSAGFHTYGVDWEPDYITWYFDGQAVASAATPSDMKDRPMYLLLNLAVGGNWAGAPNGTTLQTDPTFKIDYVRAYATPNTANVTYALNRTGSSGPDYFEGTALNDTLAGGSGPDQLYGAPGDDYIDGGGDNDRLSGGVGNDTLIGGTGDDTYLGVDASDTIIELPGGGTDTVKTSQAAWTLGDNLENLTFTGTGSFAGTGNALNNLIAGGVGDDTLVGGGGSDTLAGGGGNDVAAYAGTVDTYLITGDVDLQGSYYVFDVSTGGTDVDTLTGIAAVQFTTADPDNPTLTVAPATLVGASVSIAADGSRSIYTSDPTRVLAGLGSAATVDTVYYGGTDPLVLPDPIDNVVLTGTGQSVTAGLGANVLTGGSGDDTLAGGGGNDTLNGGGGNDVAVYSGHGADYAVILNTDTNVYTVYDERAGSPDGFDTLNGIATLRFAGDDDGTGNTALTDVGLAARANVQVASDGNGGSIITVANGKDLVAPLATGGHDQVNFSGAGAIALPDGIEDLTATGTLRTVLEGNANANVLTGGSGGTTFIGFANNDTFIGQGVTGSDTVDYSQDSTQHGGFGSVTVDLSQGIAFDGFGNFDTLVGVDHAIGTYSTDTLIGDGNINRLYGMAGADTLYGGAGDDRLDGGAGNDILDGGAGADLLIGGGDSDFGSYGDAQTGVTANLGNTSQNTGDAAGDRYNHLAGLIGSNYDDTLIGDGGANTFRGGAGNDTISGMDGADILYGEDGNDVLDGGAKSDVLYGGTGDDTLKGGAAHDNLTGGDGADTFVLDPLGGTGSSDTITDFTPGQDKLQIALSSVATPDLLSQLEVWTGGYHAPDSLPHLDYQLGNGRLFWEPGNGAASSLLATLAGKPALTAADLNIV